MLPASSSDTFQAFSKPRKERRLYHLFAVIFCLPLGVSCGAIEVPASDAGSFHWCVNGAVTEKAPTTSTSETQKDFVLSDDVLGYDLKGIVEEIGVDHSQTCGNRDSQVLTIRDEKGGISRFYLRVLDARDEISTPKLPLVVGGNVRLVVKRIYNKWRADDETVVIEDDLGLALLIRGAEFSKIGTGHPTQGLHVYEAGRDEFWSATCGEGYTYKMKFSAASSVILAPNEKANLKFNGYTYEALNIYFSRMTKVYGCTDVGGGAGAWLVVRRW